MIKETLSIRAFGWLAVAVLLAGLLAACGDDDDDDPTATSTLAAGDQVTATATDAESDPTATTASTDSTAESTDEEEQQVDATSTEDDSSEEATETEPEEAEPTATEGVSTEPTATSSGEANATTEAPGVPEVPELAELTTALENFTFQMDGVVTADATLGPQEITVSIEQFAPDNYHLKTDLAGATVAEVWLIGTTAYISAGGAGVQELPNADPSMLSAFSPALFLQPIQDNQGLRFADEIGQETVNGREATHYRLDAEAYAQGMAEAGQEVTDVSGEGGEIWVDNELNVLLKADIDIAFTDASGTEIETRATWEVSEIGTTPEVTPPQ